MTAAAAQDPALRSALLACQLFAASPLAFGGIVLRGFGPVRDALLADLTAALADRHAIIKIPVHVPRERLSGGIDLTATLQLGRSVHEPGLLERAAGHVCLIAMAERIDADIAGQIAAAMDALDPAQRCAVILLDDSQDDGEAPPPVLIERCAFHCDLSGVRALPDIIATSMLDMAPTGAPVAALSSEQRRSLAVTAAALGIDSLRPLLFAERCAYAHAARNRRDSVTSEDLACAAELVLAPLARQWPAPPEAEPEAPPMRDNHSPTEGQQQDNTNPADLTPQALADLVLAAAIAVLPPHLLDNANSRLRRGRSLAAGRAGQRQRSNQRGRPLGSRPGLPGHGRRLALLDSLRTAAPWQTIRRAEAQRQGRDCTAGQVQLRPSDLRIRRFAERQESLTIFAVDASGSAAATRLAEAKGAVELMLAQAYVRRAHVALIAFRKDASELLLPPTRSLTRAKRALGALPGGGGTPLASALIAAQQLAHAAQRRGQTPTIALLTDGKANIMLDGRANRSGAMAQAGDAARAIRSAGLDSIVIDIAVRPRPEAAALAETLHGRYLHLPLAGSSALAEAVMQAGSIGAA